MCVCMCTSVYVYMSVYMYVCMSVCMCAHVYMYECVCMFMSVCECMYMSMYVYMSVYICMCVQVCICAHMCIYECVYMYMCMSVSMHMCVSVYKCVCVFCMLLKCKVPFKLQRTEGYLKDLLSIRLSCESEFREQPSLTSTSDSLGIPWVRAEGQSFRKRPEQQDPGPQTEAKWPRRPDKRPVRTICSESLAVTVELRFQPPLHLSPLFTRTCAHSAILGLPLETSRELLAIFTSSLVGGKKVSSVWL